MTARLLLLAAAALAFLALPGREAASGTPLPASDSPAAVPGALTAFFESLISTGNIIPDTAWHRAVAPDDLSPESEVAVALPRWGDHPEPYSRFPFPDLRMRYHRGRQRDFFIVRGRRFPETVYTSDNAFLFSTMRRFRYRGGRYLVFNGRLRDYNGYGDRINFNYFFDVSKKKAVADMYENAWLSVAQPFLYGDLNTDSLLDRVRFDGVGVPAAVYAPEATARCTMDTVTITAETYRNRRWQPLLDDRSQPYRILLLVNPDEDSLVVASRHWPRPVPTTP